MYDPPPVVLVVDNESLIADVIRAMLQEISPDVEVVYVADDKAALQKAKTISPVFIVIDLKTPDRGGINLLRTLRADPDTANIPIVGTTTLYHLVDEAKTFESLCDYFLTKPFTFRQIEEIAENTMPV